MNHAATSRAPAVVGLLFVILGLGVGAGGAWLVFLGGSWYYLAAGLLMLLTGLLLYRRRPAALGIFAALFAGTLVWALWETGLDWTGGRWRRAWVCCSCSACCCSCPG